MTNPNNATGDNPAEWDVTWLPSRRGEREPVTRSYPFHVAETRSDGDGLTLEGYAAVFGAETTIDSWEGKFVERISQGAFRKTLQERTPILQFDHGYHPLIGSIPIGQIRKIAEDKQGLFVRARLTDNWLVQPIRDAIADGAIDGMSFRFETMRDEWETPEDGLPLRTLLEVRLLECGPVVWPAYEQTTVGVRSQEARRLVALIRDADDATRRDLANLLVFPPDADDELVTSGGVTDTPTLCHLSDERKTALRARANRLRRHINDFGGTPS